MADEDSKNFLKTIPLTIVDFFGALVPGMVWLVNVLILLSWVFIKTTDSPLQIWEKLAADEKTLKFLDSSIVQLSLTTIVLSISLVLGYISKTFSMEFAGSCEALLLAVLNIKKKGSKNCRDHFRQCEFPYDIYHRETKYYALLVQSVERVFGEKLKALEKSKSDNNSSSSGKDQLESAKTKSDNKSSTSAAETPKTTDEASNETSEKFDPSFLPGKVPFSFFKRLIKLLAPLLWDESVQLEAEVRMLGALSLAIVTLSGLLLILYCQFHSFSFWFVIITFVFGVVIGFAYSRRRKEEVNYTYLNALLAIGYKDEIKRQEDKKSS